MFNIYNEKFKAANELQSKINLYKLARLFIVKTNKN